MGLQPIFQILEHLSAQIFSFIVNLVIASIIDMQGFVLEVQFFKKIVTQTGDLPADRHQPPAAK